MNIIICGAGQVGAHAADVLARGGHNVTVIDSQTERVRAIEDRMDVRTLRGDAASARVLLEADTGRGDLLIAATDADDINVLTASVAKGLGCRKVIARVHHRTFFEARSFDYASHFRIDRLICPEFSTAQAIARSIRTPGALAIEEFARGRIEMHEFTVSPKAPAIGKPLREIGLPPGARLVAVRHAGRVFLPQADTVVSPEDAVVIVANAKVFEEVRSNFDNSKTPRRRPVVLMGATPMAVWVCRALRDPQWSVRLFEPDRSRAEEVAEELDWITVINADPTDRSTFQEERLDQAEMFLALTDDDEYNILGSVWAKSMGVKRAISVVQSANYLHLLSSVGIDQAFSPRLIAVEEIEELLEERPLRRLATLADETLDLYRANIGSGSPLLGKALRDVTADLGIWLIAGIRRGDDVFVPTADDSIQDGDTILAVTRHDDVRKLERALDVR